MASTYKTFLNNDSTTTRTLLHEAIPITGTIISGTYGAFLSETNIKNYSLWQSVYDYPYISSSANHIFDITWGISSASSLSSSVELPRKRTDLINMYNEMALVLMGTDKNGDIQRFDVDGNPNDGVGKMNEVVFINLARLIKKDEIKKGSFKLDVGANGTFNVANSEQIRLNDSSGSDGYFVNSPTGEYGQLFVTDLVGTPLRSGYGGTPVGLIFYQAGIAVITGSTWLRYLTPGGVLDAAADMFDAAYNPIGGDMDVDAILTSSVIGITGCCSALRHRIENLQFNNTTELNSSIYFCRLHNNEFNYSSNPTYLSASEIVVKAVSTDLPISYVTSIGLYSADNELLATAKLSEPLRKDPTTEMTVRVRLDY